MKAKIFLISFISLALAANTANAQAVKRERNQHYRIKQGVRSGELTKSEAVNLSKDQREIRQDVRLAKSDGTITPGEKRIIKREQEKESREIYRKKHNRLDRN